MHRLTRVPHSVLLTTVLGLFGFLGLGASGAAAQDKTTVVVVPINGSQILEMSTKQRIKDVDNKDQNVARVEFVAGADFRKVMVIGGGGAGMTRLVLADNDGNREAFDIVVELNIEYLKRVLSLAAPTSNIQLIQGTGSTLIVSGTVTQATDIDIIMRTVVAVVGDPNRVINALRLGGVQQVQMDVVIAHVARSEMRSFGFSFLENGTQQFLGSSFGGGGLVASALNSSIGAIVTPLGGQGTNLVFGSASNNHAFFGFLNALRNENVAKLVAQPKVTTLSGKPADFLSGGETAVPQIASGAAGGGAVSGVTFVPFGTKIKFLPLVLGDGRIYLEVEPEFTFPDASSLFSTTLPGASSPVFGRDTYRIKTSAYMEDGQTMAIGGMIFHQVTGTSSKIPVLGDIPYLGTLFGSVNYTDAEEELVILITPHLVDPMACNQLPRILPSEETRKPDDYELFLERILEAPRGPRDVWHGNTYVPAYKNAPTAGMYPAPTCNSRGDCDFSGGGASPACLPELGCPAGCNQAPVTPVAGKSGAPLAIPMAPAQQPPATLQYQPAPAATSPVSTLPRTVGANQLPPVSIDTLPLPPATQTQTLPPPPPAMRPTGYSGAIMAPPLPLDGR